MGTVTAAPTSSGNNKDSNIRANIIADADHITPPCHSENLRPDFGSEDKEMFRLKAGYISLMLSSSANKITWPKIESWLDESYRAGNR
jgi:hypothetical protein